MIWAVGHENKKFQVGCIDYDVTCAFLKITAACKIVQKPTALLGETELRIQSKKPSVIHEKIKNRNSFTLLSGQERHKYCNKCGTLP